MRWLLILFLLLPLTSFAQKFRFRNFTVADGLAQSQVFDMVQTREGYLMLGTQGGGLSRFDGLNFTTYSVKNGLASNFILSLYEDEDSILWIGTNQGLSRFDGHSFTNYSYDAFNLPVNKIIPHQNGLLLATVRGIFLFNNDSISPLPIPAKAPGFNCLTIWEAPANHTLWAGTDKGLLKISADTFEFFTTQSGLPNNHILDIEPLDSGRLLVGTYGSGIFAFDKAGGKATDRYLHQERAIVQDIFADNGQFWMATQNHGVFLLDRNFNIISKLTERDGLAQNHARKVLRDSWGNIWIGTSGGGISKYYGQQFAHYSRNQGLQGEYVYAVYRDSKGRLWTATSARGVNWFDGQEFHYFDRHPQLAQVKVRAIAEDADSNIWLGSEGDGIFIISNDSTVSQLSYANGLPANFIKDIKRDSSGNMWLATSGVGIIKVTPTGNGFEFHKFTTRNGIPDNWVNCLYIDPAQRVWFGANTRGFGYIHEDEVVKPALEPMYFLKVNSIAGGKSGELFFGTLGKGIVRYFGDGRYTMLQDELTSANVYQLFTDSLGNLWAGSEKGVDKLVFNENGDLVDLRHFGYAEGFTGVETTQNAIAGGDNGNIWFGTVNGLMRYISGQNLQDTVPPKLSLKNINLFYKPLSKAGFAKYLNADGTPNGILHFSYNENHLSFEFEGLDLSQPEKIKYQYKLEGFDKEYSPLTRQTSATYSNLPVGKYAFHVRACNDDGFCTEKRNLAAFTIAPPFYQEWWFQAAAGAFVLLVLVLLFRWRLQAARKKLKLAREQVETERKMLELEQKALRLQMNPHFIFNTLNSIQGLIATEDRKTARLYLARFSKLMRQMLENSRQQRITLHEEIDLLTNYLELEKFPKQEKFSYSIKTENITNPEEILIPPMVIQPFLENAIVHGLMHVTHPGELNVKFELQGNILICTIQDNGIGRAAAQKLRSQMAHQQKSTALEVTQERLDMLHSNGLKTIEIEDLVDAEGEVAGTRVVVRVPALMALIGN